jgi:dTDP-4-dehydrorhamnose reductase
VLGCFAELSLATEADFDMTDEHALRAAVEHAAPHVIVNAAAYTDVDGAERNAGSARAVNAKAVAVLGHLALERKIGLVHYSTDFVFDGTKGTAYGEDDEPAPLNEYGASKLEGERALHELGAPALVFRTAWVYSLRRKSFVSAILRAARERDELRVVSDQIGNPTFCRDLATASGLILCRMRFEGHHAFERLRGVYHLAGHGSCSRYDLACAALELDPKRQEHRCKTVVAVGSDQYPLPARRPLNASLDCSKAEATFGIRLPGWREALSRALAS